MYWLELENIFFLFYMDHRKNDRVRNKHHWKFQIICLKCEVVCGNIVEVRGDGARDRASDYDKNKRHSCLNLRCSHVLQASEVTVLFNAQRRTYPPTPVVCRKFDLWPVSISGYCWDYPWASLTQSCLLHVTSSPTFLGPLPFLSQPAAPGCHFIAQSVATGPSINLNCSKDKFYKIWLKA